jgi:hypothetical protein
MSGGISFASVSRGENRGQTPGGQQVATVQSRHLLGCFRLGKPNGLMVHGSCDKPARCQPATKSFPRTISAWRRLEMGIPGLPKNDLCNFLGCMTPCVQRLVFESY